MPTQVIRKMKGGGAAAPAADPESPEVRDGGAPVAEGAEETEGYTGVVGWELSGGATSKCCMPALMDPRALVEPP